MNFELNYKRYGENAILIEWVEEISPIILEDIIYFKHKIKTNQVFLVQEVVNGYNSLTVVYPSKIKNYSDSVNQLKLIYLDKTEDICFKNKLWQIPVCYDEEYGFDLKTISLEKKLSIKEIIKLHNTPIYKVYFIGFLPGFLYLGGLDDKLEFNRKASPKLKVPKGSVAIGGNQTGIYPSESAGGWHIIGKTPIPIFDISNENPCFANSGDQIQFVSISKNEFYDIENDIIKGKYLLKCIEND